MSEPRREIRREDGRTFYVLHFDGGAMTYEAYPFEREHANVNHHWRTQTGCDTLSPDPCEFLDGQPCYFDGTGLAPAQDTEEGIWALLERYAPKARS
jgi:hypothetical protein